MTAVSYFPSGNSIQPDLLQTQTQGHDLSLGSDRNDTRSIEEVIQADVAAASFANFAQMSSHDNKVHSVKQLSFFVHFKWY